MSGGEKVGDDLLDILLMINTSRDHMGVKVMTRSNYKFINKKVFLLKKINFYISNIISSIVPTFIMYFDIQQVVKIIY